MKKTDYETWKEIGEQAKRVQTELYELGKMLSGNVPKSVYQQQFSRMDDALSKLRSDLEDRLAKEHPDKWEVEDFYGSNDMTPHRKQNDGQD